MAHVTMIHGISNKPPADALLAGWERALAANGGIDLASEGITTSMAYWADVMYEKPGGSSGTHESTGPEVIVSESDEDTGWRDRLSDEERLFVDSIAGRLNVDAESPEGDDFVAPEEAQDGSFERIPIPWFIKRRLMKVLLRDVHHYLFNAESRVREDTYRVQDEIRRRFVETLQEDAHSNSGPHVVVSHSMGTVISYDCLKRVPGCPAIDALFTLGAPLGLDEIQDKMKPEWSRDDGFPDSLTGDAWTNVFDRLDIVAALDPEIRNDYRRRGTDVIEDVSVDNSGWWRHDVTSYLGQKALRESLAHHLGV